MAIIQSFFFYITTTAFFFGPSLRLNILSVSVPIFDILLILYTLSSIPNHKPKNTKFIFLAVWTIITYLINIPTYDFNFRSLFYLIRLLNFYILLIYIPTLSKNQIKYTNLVIVANIIFSYLQYCLWPDLTNYMYLGWDPHLYRLTSTFLDPTFTGLIFLIFLTYIYFNISNIYILIFIYVSIALTYSRSTLLSLSILSIYLSKIQKNYKLALTTLLIISLTIIILPHTIGEGTNLKRTSTIKAKIQNYKQAINLIIKKPILGYGYNNLSQARSINPSNHASFGFDSSLLTITSTTGLIGLFLFLKCFFGVFSQGNPLQKSLILIIFCHSLFSNSLLYPWVYFLLYSYYSTTKNRK